MSTSRSMLTKAQMGSRLRAARFRQTPRLRQRDVDDLVGVPSGRTAHYENGRAAPPHGYLVRLASIWDIPVAWFVDPDADETPPTGGRSPNYGMGVSRLQLRGDLPIGQWNAQSEELVDVDSKFSKQNAFAARVVGIAFAPRAQHGDVLIFWPLAEDAQPGIGVISLCESDGAPPRVVIPEYDARRGKLALFPPGGGEPLDGVELKPAAIAVGLKRTLPGGDILTLSNLTGLRSS